MARRRDDDRAVTALGSSAARLVVVSGPPATGKTTLAIRLGRELGLPVISKDGFKEALFDTLGTGDLAWSQRLGGAAYALLYRTAAGLLAAGGGVLVEANFSRGMAEAELHRIGEGARAVVIHLSCAREAIAARYASRASTGRHPGHEDGRYAGGVLADLDAGRYEPLSLGWPLLRVDATEGYVPAYEDIVGFARRALG